MALQADRSTYFRLDHLAATLNVNSVYKVWLFQTGRGERGGLISSAWIFFFFYEIFYLDKETNSSYRFIWVDLARTRSLQLVKLF